MAHVESKFIADDGTTVLGSTGSEEHTLLEFQTFFLKVSTELGYQALVPDGENMVANPETRMAFCFRMARQYLSSVYNSVRAREAAAAARQSIADTPFQL